MFDFDTMIDRRGSGSEKWEKYAGRDILPMWVADMDFRSPPVVVEALRRRTEHGVFGYTKASPGTVEAVVGMLARDFGWTLDPAWLVWLPGLVSGPNVTCRSVGEQGDDVLSWCRSTRRFSPPRASRCGDSCGSPCTRAPTPAINNGEADSCFTP